MARMVFGNWATGLGKASEVTHYVADRSPEAPRVTACGIAYHGGRGPSVYLGPLDNEARLAKGEQMTTCKNCRRQMGWPTPTDHRNRR